VGLFGVEQAPVAAHAALPVCARSFLLAAFSDLSPSTLKPDMHKDDVPIRCLKQSHKRTGCVQTPLATPKAIEYMLPDLMQDCWAMTQLAPLKQLRQDSRRRLLKACITA